MRGPIQWNGGAVMSHQSSARPGAAIVSDFATDPDMRELVDFFVSALPERIGALRAALAEKRMRDLERLAHQMKGAAGGYGFPALGSAAAALEGTLKEAESPELERVQRELAVLVNLCDRAIAGGAATGR